MAKRIMKKVETAVPVSVPVETKVMEIVIPSSTERPSSARTGRTLLPVPSFTEATVIKTVAINPKPGASRERYSAYEPGENVGNYVSACKALGYSRSKALADIKWDVARGFVVLQAE